MSFFPTKTIFFLVVAVAAFAASSCTTRRQDPTQLLDGYALHVRFDTPDIMADTFPITLVTTSPVIRNGKVVIPAGSRLQGRRIDVKDAPFGRRSIEGHWVLKLGRKLYPIEGYIFDGGWRYGVPDRELGHPTTAIFYVTRVSGEPFEERLPEKGG
jgi:hypothetical protein